MTEEIYLVKGRDGSVRRVDDLTEAMAGNATVFAIEGSDTRRLSQMGVKNGDKVPESFLRKLNER